MVFHQHMLTWIFMSALSSLAVATLPHKRFEYKLSFKGPHLVQRDGTIPFWDHGGRKWPALLVCPVCKLVHTSTQAYMRVVRLYEYP